MNTLDDEDFYPSKSDDKRAAERLKELGEKLATLTDKQLSKLPIDETLLNALMELKRLKAREALRRHKQYIGKLMRGVDESRLLAALDPMRDPALLRQLDLAQQRLLELGDGFIGEVLQRYSAGDRHTLRQYVRLAQKEAQSEAVEKSTAAQDKLRLYLREIAELSR